MAAGAGAGDPPVAVIGDALVDVVTGHDGSASEHPGGAGLNVAVGVARHGVRSLLAYPTADDAHGTMLRRFLGDEGVEVVPLPGARESAVAWSTSVGGEPEYQFSDAVVNRLYTYTPQARAQIATARAVAVSSFPMGDQAQVTALIEVAQQAHVPLAVDANARPTLLPDRDAYRSGFLRLAAAAAVVKVSREDLEVLFDESPSAVVQRLRAQGTAAVVLTDGARGATAHTDVGEVHVTPPRSSEPIINAMGAGDAFFSALIVDLGTPSWPHTDDHWRAALRRATDIAAAVCRVPGALAPLTTPSHRNQGEIHEAQ